MHSQQRLFVKIWDRDRLIKKSFILNSNFQTLIEKANAAGIPGSKLVLEADGTEIDDLEVLEYFIQKNEIFQLIDTTATWVPAASTSSNISSVHETITENSANNVITWIATNDEFLSSSPLSSTVSMSSGRITSFGSDNTDNSASIGLKQAEKLFANYSLPINKIQNEIMELLNQGQPLGKLFTDFVHCVVNDMRQKSYYIPQKIFRKIAARLIESYPNSLAVTDSNGKLICSEPITLATKLCNHNNYLNRNSEASTVTPSLKRKINISDGVPNFFEKTSGEQLSDNEAEDKRMWLKDNYGREINNDELKEEIFQTFKSTFNKQRKFLNENPTMKEVDEQWPHLLSYNFLTAHFFELMDIEDKLFFNRWDFMKQKILSFGHKYKTSILDVEPDEDIQILKIITTYLNENIDILLKKYPYGSSLNDIDLETSTPFIAVIDQPENNHIIYFYVERQLFNADCNSIKMAVLLLIAAFYVFNIQYPAELSQSLEAMQKIFLDMNVNFVRSKKQKMNFKSKVVNFLKKIL